MEPGGRKSTPLSPNLWSKRDFSFFCIFADVDFFFTFFMFLHPVPPGGEELASATSYVEDLPCGGGHSI